MGARALGINVLKVHFGHVQEDVNTDIIISQVAEI